MKFAHIADIHLGAWREQKMRDANAAAFASAIETCINEKVDFVVIAGDVFNSAMPSIDSLRIAAEQLKKLNDYGIAVYAIAGSHDFSPGGKTVLDVFTSAGLFINVSKGSARENQLRLEFTKDEKTGIKITGLIGRKGGLDKNYYYSLDRDALANEPGKKIFVFHAALSELKPSELAEIDAMAVSLLPKGFDYYAGGHVHIAREYSTDGYPNVVYPGPVFPNNFAELEKLREGSMCIVEDWKMKKMRIKTKNIVIVKIDCTAKTPAIVEKELQKQLEDAVLDDAIVMIRLHGELAGGKASDIDLNSINSFCESRGAYFVMRNTGQLTNTELETVKIAAKSIDEIEEELIKEHTGKSPILSPANEKALVKALLQALSAEKKEGEKSSDFESRICNEADVLFQQDKLSN